MVPPEKAEVRPEQHQVLMAVACKKTPADLTQGNLLQNVSFKVSNQRLHLAGLGNFWLASRVAYHENLTTKQLPSPRYLSRLLELLFPKHYFW